MRKIIPSMVVQIVQNSVFFNIFVLSYLIYVQSYLIYIQSYLIYIQSYLIYIQSLNEQSCPSGTARQKLFTWRKIIPSKELFV